MQKYLVKESTVLHFRFKSGILSGFIFIAKVSITMISTTNKLAVLGLLTYYSRLDKIITEFLVLKTKMYTVKPNSVGAGLAGVRVCLAFFILLSWATIKLKRDNKRTYHYIN